MERFDVIVIGLGAMGTAACFHLASRGLRVLGLEQFEIGHALGSSHGESRMIRLCYYEHPDYVPLLRRAYELWHELERTSGRKLLHMTGGLYMGRPESEFVQGSLRAAREHGLPHEWIEHAELKRRFPQFVLPSDHAALFEPNAGFLLPELVVRTHAELAAARGAVLREREEVLAWRSDHLGVRVTTGHAEYAAERLIICGGAWSERLMGGLGVPLKVTRQVLGWVKPMRPELFALGTLPVWAIDQPDGTQHYGFPMLPSPGGMGFKIAHHFHGPQTSVEKIVREPRAEDEGDFRWVLREMIPEADGPLRAMQVCMYTCSPDSHFIIDRHPRFDRVVVACGFSGHGFKFATVVGEALADLAHHGRTAHPIAFLGLKRFAAV